MECIAGARIGSVTPVTDNSPATGEHTTNGMPHGSTSLTPHLVITQAAKALDFYRDVFGARIMEVTRFPGSDMVTHAQLDFGTGMMTMGEPMEAYNLVAPDPGNGVTYCLSLYVPNVDEVTANAVACGAAICEKPVTFVSGDRFSVVLDPFGVRWSIVTRVEDLSPAESANRVASWAAAQQA